MRDREIKDRVAAFLRQTARQVVLPATLGLGLGLGCGGHRVVVQQPGDAAVATPVDPAAPADPGANPSQPQVPPSEARYGAPFYGPEAGVADEGPDQGAVAKYGAPFADDAAPPNASMYAAPFPGFDAGSAADPDGSA